MRIETARFGPLEIPEEEIFRFPWGLPGFAEEKSFVFLPHKPDSPFAFLQSATDPNLTFLITDPFAFFADYELEIEDELAEEIGLSQENPGQVWNIVTVPEKLEDMTANLLAPVLLNWKERLGAQLVLQKTAYTTRHRLYPQGLKKAAGDGAQGGV